jgi:hypothetical protein
VGRLDPVGIVFDRLLGFLIEIGEVGAGGLSGVLGLVGLQEFGLDDVPIVNVKSIFNEPFKPCNSPVPEAHLEFKDLAVYGPVANIGCVIDTDNEQASGNVVLAWLAIREQNIL